MPRVSAIIPSFNRADELSDCLRSIEALDLLDLVEAIVVDNGSEDDTCDMVRRDFPRARLLQNGQNRGAARAKNQGAAEAGGDLLWFLDSDTEIPGPGVVHRSMELLEGDPTVGAVGGEIYEAPDGQRTWRRKDLLPNGETRTVSHERGYGGVVEVDYLPSCNLMMRADLFCEIGGFDPGYFFLVEDTDLCVRLRHRGYRCLASDETSIFHRLVLRGRRGDLFLVHRNRVRFALLNYPAWQVAALPLLDLANLVSPYKLAALRGGQISAEKHIPPSLRGVKRGPLAFAAKLAMVGADYLRSLARGYAWNLSHLPETLPLRRAEPRDFL